MSGWLFSRRRCLAALLLAHFVVVRSFEVFSEQQLLVLDDPTRVVDFNNTEYGSTHVDDYWAKIDLTYSPLEGWSLSRHVRIGCFLVQWESPLAYAEKVSGTITPTECVQFCNRTQAYLRVPYCRCGLDETLLPMTEVQGECIATAWQVFREYDYRSSMSPSTYDTVRRLLYSIVTVRLPAPADPSIRNYIHAVNALEGRPEFDYDVRLDRMLFNSVWDFGKSRMVALSLSDWGGTLDFSVVSFNSSSAGLEVKQTHFPIEDQIVATGQLVPDGMASAEGLGTVDVLFGTYYTVVPAMLPGSTQVVHVIVAIDIDMKRVLTSQTLPVTLMNLQSNSLNHELYGAGADLTGQYAYYHLCTSENLTQTVGGVTTIQVSVGCQLTELGGLPSEVNYMTLQSAAIDHQYNYAWFTYKEEPTGRPRILEYHQDSKDYVVWPQDALPENAVYSSLVQTAPRIFFALYPPSLRYARFNEAGTKIFVSFDAATLRGAIPVDTNGDDVLDFYNEADKASRAACDNFIDQFTMDLIPGTMCQWTSDADFYIEIQQQSTIAPGDLARIKPGTVYRGQEVSPGVWQFSQPSSDFAVVEAPAEILPPKAEIGGMSYIDVCTELILDGTQSKNHGFRGAFAWGLHSTTPEMPEPHIRQLQNLIEEEMANAYPVAAHILRVPQYLMQGGSTYNFSLTVQSFWDPTQSDTTYFSVTVSTLPVPPMEIFGSYYREIKVESALSLVSEISLEGCSANLGSGAVTYTWTGCKRSEAVLQNGILSCSTWGSGINLDTVSGLESRSLYVLPFGLSPLESYIFTVAGKVTISSEASELVLSNLVSTEVNVVLGGLQVMYYGGSGFSSRRDRTIVIDFFETSDFSDPDEQLATMTFSYSCKKEGTADPCFPLQMASPSDTSLSTAACVDLADPLSNPPGLPMKFVYRNQEYNHAEGISVAPLSNVQKYCRASITSFIFQTMLFDPGMYLFVTNVSKVVNGVERVDSKSLYLTVLTDTEVDGTRNPLLAVFLESPLPVFPGATIRLRGEVTNPQNDTVYSYYWTAYRFGLNPAYDAEANSFDPNYAVVQYTWVELSAVDFNVSDPQQVRTPPNSRFMAIAPDVLQPGWSYKIRITAVDAFLEAQGVQDPAGFAEYTFTTQGLPPSGGELTADITSGTALETEFVFIMDGYGSEDRPLSYQFSYIQDYDSPFAEAVELTILYSERNYIKTRLPQGASGNQSMLRVIGTVKSAVGSMAQASIDVSVSAPADERTAIDSFSTKVQQVDPETAILYATLLAETPATTAEEIALLAQVVEGKMFASNRTIARTPEMVSSVANMLLAVADKGVRVDSAVSYLSKMVNLSVELGFIEADGSLGSSTSVDVAGSLLYAIDAIIPGVVPTYGAATARRLKGGRGMGGKVPAEQPRRLQGVETRAPEDMYRHFLAASDMTAAITAVIHAQIYPAEVPVSFALPGQDIYLGKDFTVVEEQALPYVTITSLFDLPSLEQPEFPSIFNYKYVQFKKFPYDFLILPGNRSLDDPQIYNNSATTLVPTQDVSPSERLWHAMSLIITDEAGNGDLIERSLVNISYSMLPKIAAYDAGSFGNVLFPSTCFWVDLGAGNFSNADFDARGSVFSEDSCITMHTDHFVVLADDLASQLEVVAQSPGEFLSQYEDTYTTSANVVTATLLLVACAGFVMVSVYVDEHDAANKVTPLDSLPSQVIDREDPKEKVLGTIFQSMRRNHLVVGWNYFHLKLTRVRRAGIFIVAIFATEALAVLQHSLLAIKVERAWGASGLVAAVLVFPIVQFLEFCFEWLPQSRMLAKPPPRSMPAQPIPLREQAKPKPFKYPRRPAVGKVRPPEPKVGPRAEHSLQLPVMPVLQLSQSSGSTKGRPQPPARPPQLPKPPQGPAPPGHLPARARSPDATPELGLTGFSDLSQLTPGSIGPFGLTLPELPPLPQGNLKAIADGAPKPAPPPKGSSGPRPPKTPPPMSKMFFVTPKGVQVAVPQLPLPSTQPRSSPPPPLPKLPPLRSLVQLSTVRSGGESSRSRAPPPPGVVDEPPVAYESPLRHAGGSLRLDVPKQAPLDLPSSILSRVPMVQKHTAGIAPPPPPLPAPPPGPKLPAAERGPLPPEDGEPLVAVRRLAKVRPGQVVKSMHPPKPPPKMPGRALPTPPAGPPPAHAIVLAKGTPQDFPGNDFQAVIAKAKPPPPLVHPPSEPLPAFVYRTHSKAALQTIMDARESGPKASALEPLPPKAPPLNDTLAFAALPPVVKEYVPPERGAKPVPEFVVKVSVWIVYLFVFWIFVYSVGIIAFYGVYMPSSSIWASYAATLCGCLLNFGILESMKCIVLGCVELLKHETVRRQAELDAKRTRMALKEQRQEQRARLQEFHKMHVAPPLMG
ncbi:unnamed protein product [Effrenium voratum]|uniref:PKD/REJ-like domain-containing protein n=1 Tax=Effrenium voratum TaxID=2562239 RepID=A0AA36JHC5_9DINO|nr:unnamed protein product [Effrenium voratum]